MANKSIGEANVKLTVDGAEEVASKLKEVKKDLDEVGDSGTTAAGRIDDSMKGAGDAINSATAGVRGLLRSFTGVLGIVGALGTLFGFVFGGIIRNLQDAKEQADKLNSALEQQRKSLRGIVEDFTSRGEDLTLAEQIEKDAADAIKKLQEQSKEAAEELDELIEKSGGYWSRFGAVLEAVFSLESISEVDARRLAELEKKARDHFEAISVAREAIIQERDDRLRKLEEQQQEELIEIEKQASERRQQLDDQNAQRRLELLDGEEREEAAHAIRVEQIRRDLADAIKDDDKERIRILKEAFGLERQIADQRIEGIRKANEERKKAQQQRDEQQARRETDRALRELAKALETQARQTNELNRSMEQLSRDVNNFTGDIMRVGDGIRR